MKYSCGRIWWLTRNRKSKAVVFFLFVCLFWLGHPQNATFAAGQRPGAANLANREAEASPQVMSFVPQTTIPNVTGFKVVEAQRIVAGKFTLAAADNRSVLSPDDVISDQLPKADKTARPGSTIQIWLKQVNPAVTTYIPAPSKQVPVPNLVGHTRESAIAILDKAGFSVSKIGIQESEESDDIVLSQYPNPPAMVPLKSAVSFTVSKQIQRTLTITGPSSGKPGDPLTYVAHLDPPFPATQYLFAFGAEPIDKLDFSPQREHRFPADGDFDVKAYAQWDGGSTKSAPLRVIVHPTSYVVTLTPTPAEQTEGQTIQFHAEVVPPVENAHYTFDFGDKTKPVRSKLPDFHYAYKLAGSYSAIVRVSIPEHSHTLPSNPTVVTIKPSIMETIGGWLNANKIWIIGSLVFLGGGFVIGRKLLHPPENHPQETHVEAQSNIELRPAILPGKFRITVQGRLWSRIEGMHGRNR
jgi:hypothetical protein